MSRLYNVTPFDTIFLQTLVVDFTFVDDSWTQLHSALMVADKYMTTTIIDDMSTRTKLQQTIMKIINCITNHD